MISWRQNEWLVRAVTSRQVTDGTSSSSARLGPALRGAASTNDSLFRQAGCAVSKAQPSQSAATWPDLYWGSVSAISPYSRSSSNHGSFLFLIVTSLLAGGSRKIDGLRGLGPEDSGIQKTSALLIVSCREERLLQVLLHHLLGPIFHKRTPDWWVETKLIVGLFLKWRYC